MTYMSINAELMLAQRLRRWPNPNLVLSLSAPKKQ